MITSYNELCALFRLTDPQFRQLRKGLGAKIHICQKGIEVDDEQLVKYLLAFRSGEVMTAREVARQYKVAYGNVLSWSLRGLLPYYQLTTTKGSLHLYIRSELTDDLWILHHNSRQVNTIVSVYFKIFEKVIAVGNMPYANVLRQYINGKTMEQIAQELDITEQRVNQLVKKAIKDILARLDYVLTVATLNQKYKEKYFVLQSEYQKLLRDKPAPTTEDALPDINIRDTVLGDYPRIINTLTAGGVYTIKDLLSLKSTDLQKFRNLGYKSIMCIMAFVEKYHLKFADQI